MTDPTQLQDRGHLHTEKRLPASSQLDALSITDALRVMNEQDAAIPTVINDAIPRMTPLVDAIVRGLRQGGRLAYIGAGTSGRLGVLDASEIPPTFQAEHNTVVGIIAGGDGALRNSSEHMEDDPIGAHDELARLELGPNDTLIGIAAGGTTPYVWGALRFAKRRGATTGFIACVRLAPLAEQHGVEVDHPIELIVGPEVITGSTRMKAGTATKLALNMISTVTMVRLGKVWGNLMVDLRATNAKLMDRAIRIVTDQCDVSREGAAELIRAADGRVKLALIMARLGVDADEAQRLLTRHDDQLRPIIGEPR